MTGALGGDAIRRLKRFVAKPDAVETCDLCGERIAAEHPHLFESRERRLVCACRACALVFPAEGGAGTHRLLETRVEPLPDVRIRRTELAALDIPVTLVFLAPSVLHDTTFVVYPNAGGAAEARSPLSTWKTLLGDHPELAGVRLDAEGILVDGAEEPSSTTCLSLDAWHAVIGSLKASTGGGAVRERIARALHAVSEARR